MSKMRPCMILCLCLSLALALMGVTAAIACPEPVTAVTACDHDGARVVWLDAQGKPVSKSCPHCPDCLGGVAALPVSAPGPALPEVPARALTLSEAPAPVSLSLTHPVARGPPAGIEI